MPVTERTMKARELGHQTYEEYLRSSHWKGKRKEYRQSGRPCVCAVCQSPTVQFHHVTYERLGSELLDDLVPVCEYHHSRIHAVLKAEDRPLSDTPAVIERLKLMGDKDRTGEWGRVQKIKMKGRVVSAYPTSDLKRDGEPPVRYPLFLEGMWLVREWKVLAERLNDIASLTHPSLQRPPESWDRAPVSVDRFKAAFDYAEAMESRLYPRLVELRKAKRNAA